MPLSKSAPHVHKFGGASLADAAAIGQVVAIVRKHRPEPAVVVVSAMAGATDALLAVAGHAVGGDERRVAELIGALRAKYARAARAVVPRGRARTTLLSYIAGQLDELVALASGLRLLRDLTPRTSDFIVARGERLSAHLVTAALLARGVRARYVDATAIVRTDAHYGHASPDYDRSDRAARRMLRPLLARRIVPVVPGFLGASPADDLTTLGRGGSDLTATMLARALGASRISLWKDVPGLLTADPRIVPDARVIPALHTREAAELAYYGAKVLHPRALIPLAGRKIPLYVRPDLERHRSLRAGGGGAIAGESALRRHPSSVGHGSRQRHARRAGHRGAHLCRAPAAAHFGVAHLAGLFGALDLLQRA
jgi:aspartate kinase